LSLMTKQVRFVDTVHVFDRDRPAAVRLQVVRAPLRGCALKDTGRQRGPSAAAHKRLDRSPIEEVYADDRFSIIETILSRADRTGGSRWG
jgi:hypothetical protein